MFRSDIESEERVNNRIQLINNFKLFIVAIWYSNFECIHYVHIKKTFYGQLRQQFTHIIFNSSLES